MVATQTGLRVSELTSLTRADAHLGTGAHVSTVGKGRKQRITPLIPETVAILRAWLAEHRTLPAEPLFPTRRGGRLSPDAVERRLTKHVATAALTCPTLAENHAPTDDRATRNRNMPGREDRLPALLPG
jgi:integrase/recombinase XerD